MKKKRKKYVYQMQPLLYWQHRDNDVTHESQFCTLVAGNFFILAIKANKP